MMSTVIGGAMLPHAPQFFTMPETEDKKNVEHVREVAADVGKKLRALQPDLWIIFSNDHAEQFFHTTAPPFTVHVGGEATGEFAGRSRNGPPRGSPMAVRARARLHGFTVTEPMPAQRSRPSDSCFSLRSRVAVLRSWQA